MIRVKSPQDFGAGILFVLIGMVGVYFGKDLAYGTATRMGPGFFPIWLSWIIFGMGTILIARGLAFNGGPIEMPQLRPLIGIIGATLIFGLVIVHFGLPIAVIVLVFVAAYARPNPSVRETALLAVGLAVFAVLAFVFALGQPLPLWWAF